MASRFGGYDIDEDGGYEDDAGASGTAEPLAVQEPVFTKKYMAEIKIPEKETIVQLAAADGVLFVGISNLSVLRHQSHGADDLVQLLPKRQPGDLFTAFYVDPTASHMIAVLQLGGTYESVYIHLPSKKPTKLRSLKGFLITAVAWNPAAASPDVPSTHDILVGDSQGGVYELEITNFNERAAKKVYVMPGELAPVTGLHMDVLAAPRGGKKYYLMISNPSKFIQFMGSPSASDQSLFGPIFATGELINSSQEVMPLAHSRLSFFQRFPAPAEAFTWLTHLGVYYGSFDFQNALDTGQTAVPAFKVIPYNIAGDAKAGAEDEAVPLAMGLTEFHVVLLYKDVYRAICVLNNKQVVEERFPVRKVGELVGLVKDSRTNNIYCYTKTRVIKIDSSQETRDVWRLFLEQGQFSEALRYCHGKEEKNQVLLAQADAEFNDGDYTSAAVAFAKAKTSFENVSLKFLGKGQDAALRTFLKQKLRQLDSSERTQSAMLATWMVELYLTSLNALQEQGEAKRAEHLTLFDEFKGFLQLDVCQKVLDKDTVFDLIASHGNVEAMLFYAKQKGDYEIVLQHHLQRFETAQAMEVLGEQARKRPDLVYRFAPELIQSAPSDLIKLARQFPNLEPRELIPAFVRYQQQANHIDATTMLIVQYLEWCIANGSKDAAIHNYLISLYVQLPDDAPLLQFIRDNQKQPQFDRKYALRLSTEHKKIRACVAIYSQMGLYKEALELALMVDPELAREQAEAPQYDRELKRKLWLRIARYFMESEGGNVQKAMEVLRDCPQLKIEDILPFFPDFVVIDPFQAHIQHSLELYNEQIQELRRTMDTTTKSARAIRQDILQLNRRYEVVNGGMKCQTCNHPLLTRAFYIFPCSHAFHKDCCIAEVIKFVKPSQRKKVDALQNELKRARLDRDPGTDVNKLNEELDEIVSQDCPTCGEIAIRLIEEPFIPEDKLLDYVQSWSLGEGLMTTGDEFGLKEGESVVVAAAGAFRAAGGKSSADDGPMDLENYDPLADL